MSIVYQLLKLNRKIKSDRIKLLFILAAQILNKRYFSVRIDPIFACNLRCRMCYFSKSRKSDSKKFTIDELNKLAENLFKNALQVAIGCGAEPTLYKDYPYIIKLAKDKKVPFVSLVTNGQLLNEESIKNILDAKLDELIISLHGTTKETYEYFMQGAKWEKLHEVLTVFSSLKNYNPHYKTRLRLNYTLNNQNLNEIETIFSTFGKYGFSTLQIRPVMELGGEYEEKIDSEIYNQYFSIIEKLKNECKNNNVLLLANVSDPSFSKPSKPNLLISETYKYVSPNYVADESFWWKEENYRQFLIRTGWHKKMLKKIFLPHKQVLSEDFAEKYSGKYELI